MRIRNIINKCSNSFQSKLFPFESTQNAVLVPKVSMNTRIDFACFVICHLLTVCETHHAKYSFALKCRNSKCKWAQFRNEFRSSMMLMTVNIHVFRSILTCQSGYWTTSWPNQLELHSVSCYEKSDHWWNESVLDERLSIDHLKRKTWTEQLSYE